jgi:hypothetical protein
MQLAISGYGGVAFPVGNLVDYFLTDPMAARIKSGHTTGWTAGGRFAVWPSRRLGIEVEAGYVSSNVDTEAFIEGADTPLEALTASASFFTGSLNVLYAVIAPALDPLAIHVSGGVGVVGRGGTFFSGGLSSGTKTDVAGVLGVGLRYGLGPGWRFRLDLKDYISSFYFEELDEALQLLDLGLPRVDSQIQNDILVTAGIEVYFSPGS